MVIAPVLLVLCAAAGQPERPAPPVPFPHPLITEVLYAVPTGTAGDANKDGVRDTSGDEFIELVNPHDKPIGLRGYVLSGKAPEAAAKGKEHKVLKFVFPAIELAPGEVVVVFNGHDAKWAGPVGDTTRAPREGSEQFFGARVFTMNVESARMGLANKADYVLLTAPRGELVQCVKWGDIKAPEGTGLVEEAPSVNGQSVSRRDVGDRLEPHPTLEGVKYSPGRFPMDAQRPSEDGGDKDPAAKKLAPGKQAPEKPAPERPRESTPEGKPAKTGRG